MPRSERARAASAALLLTGAVVASFIAMYLPQPALPDIGADLGAGRVGAGMVISALTLGIAFASPLVALLSDRFGRRAMLVGSSLLLALPTAACALAPGLGALLALRTLQGVFVAGVLSTGLAYIGEEFGTSAARRLAGAFIAASVAGGTLSRLLGGWSADLLGWRWGFAISGALCLAMGALLAARLPPSRGFVGERDLRSAARGMAAHLRDPTLLRLYAVGAALFASFLGMFTALPFRLDAPPYDLAPGPIGLAYLSYLAGVVSANATGPLLARVPARRLLAASLVATALAHLVAGAGPLPVVVSGLVALCFGQFVTQGVAAALLATAPGASRAGANALYLSSYYLGGAAGSLLLVAAWDRFGWAGVEAGAVAALLAGAVAAATMPATAGRAAASGPPRGGGPSPRA